MIINLRWAFRTLAPHSRILMLLVALMTIIGSLLSALQPVIARSVVNGIVDARGLAGLWPPAAAMAASFLVPAALTPVSGLLRAIIEERTLRRIDELIMDAGAAMPDLGTLEQPEIHDRVRLVQTQIFTSSRLAQMSLAAVSYVLGAVTLLISLATLTWWLPLVLIAAAIPHVIGEWNMARVRFQTLRDQSRAAREMDYYLSVVSEPQLAKEVRAFGLGAFFLHLFDRRSGAALRQLAGVRLRSARMTAIGVLCYATAVLICFGYVARSALSGSLSVGDVALYLTAITSLFLTLFNISLTGVQTVEGIKNLDALRELTVGARPGIALSDHGRTAPARFERGISLSHVAFSYRADGDHHPVLRDVDLVIPAGKVLALVGENGEGKSTLVKLLTRMYDPDSGVISIDGTPIEQYDLGSLRQRIATVYQDHARFALTAEENIAIADPDLLASDVPNGERRRLVAEAARKGGADTVIADLTDGYDAELTRQFGGVDLSGGEWQRVATARAFLPDAALIILDEPTSALDVDAERRLFDSFAELVQGRTAIMISHRFSTVRTADVIAVLADGRIAEYGSHAELMALNGRYAELFNLQADRYRD